MAHDTLPEIIQAARIRCVQDRPYLAGLLYRLVPVAKPGIGTLAVDKWMRLYFDPTCRWTVEQYATVLYHEAGHVLRDHAGREESLGITPDQHLRWNTAADAEINDDLNAEGGMTWPFPVVTPSALGLPDGLFAEEYYDKLPKPPPAKGPSSGACGSASGAPLPFEEPGPSGKPGADETRGILPAEQDAIRHKVASDAREYERSGRGTLPAHMKAWVKVILNPKVDWRKVLRASMRSCLSWVAGMQDYSYQRPGRRQSVLPDVVIPSMRQPAPLVATVIDTSGSVSDAALSAALGEVASVLKQCGQKDGVTAIVCDAAVDFAKRVYRADQIQVSGRGGTDMRVGINHALSMRPKPHVIIVLTDGDTPWPDTPIPGVRLIACILGQARGLAGVPEFIKGIHVDLS